MSWSGSIYGHGQSADKVKDAFAAFIKALDEATEDGSMAGGSVSGQDVNGQPFSYQASQAREDNAKMDDEQQTWTEGADSPNDPDKADAQAAENSGLVQEGEQADEASGDEGNGSSSDEASDTEPEA